LDRDVAEVVYYELSTITIDRNNLWICGGYAQQILVCGKREGAETLQTLTEISLGSIALPLFHCR